MVKRMLVDATHPEETRVVVVNGTKLEEFDFETSTKKQLKGNIYLAKVIRIEPSLQAAFVEYGGNRHGFLAFSEIHPDYYQIPVADREAILAEQERRARQAEENEGQERPSRRRGRNARGRNGERGQRGERRNGDAPSPVLSETDAIDAVVAPDQAGDIDDQPAVETWDHETAQAGDYRRSVETEIGEPEYSADTQDADEDERVEETSGAAERERLDRDGDFREAEASWDRSYDDDAAGDEDRSEAETAAGADAEAGVFASSDKSSDGDSEPDNYATERQNWPVTYDTAPRPDEVIEADATRPEPSEEQFDEQPDETDSLAPAEALDAAREAVETGDVANGELTEVETPVSVETVGGDDLGEEERPRRQQPLRTYKIQEVIKRRQILLVQVVKEERGNKGAALTTYLSLAGRYCVLMPNAGRGGGISRKITNAADRKRMRDMLSELEVPQGMGVILRTAGLERSKPEIRRDYDYLIRLWDNIREVTLKSTAPALIYEEGNLIKRSIRDLYGKEIEELQIEGEDAYRHAKEFMRQLMPSHAKKVQLYRDPIPLFHRYQVEAQLDAMHSPVVQLKSGAYIVINPTEALVAIDVNSGRATKERNIEETALRTNVEAAEEIARQLRLRDLAGLIVIDFIDMEDQRHQAQVERRLKEAMRSDRARIQIGRISAFGLLELSRQRLRPSLLETSTEVCPHCEGTGRIRSTESTALHVLRAIEEEGIRRRAAEIRVTVPTHVALYLLNQKRAGLAEIEARYGFRVVVDGDDRLIPPNFTLERSRNRPADQMAPVVPLATAAYDDETDAVDAEVAGDDVEAPAEETVAADVGQPVTRDDTGGRRRRRRRRRRRGEDDAAEGEAESAQQESAQQATGSDEDDDAGTEPEDEAPENAAADAESSELGPDGLPRRRRRGRRGGRRRRQGERPDADRLESEVDNGHAETDQAALPSPEQSNGLVEEVAAGDSPSNGGEQPHAVDETEAPRRTAHQSEPAEQAQETVTNGPAMPPAPAEPEGPPRRGWWQRLTSGS
ncbi:MAG: Rne/Rng family ribonuclease [Hyphomonadaceae bacterium]